MVGRLSGQVALDMEKTFRIRLHSRQAQAGAGASGVHGRRARVSADAYKGQRWWHSGMVAAGAALAAMPAARWRNSLIAATAAPR